MSDAPPSPRSPWRDFLNRREPGARWMLALLVLVAAAEIIWLFCYEGDKTYPMVPANRRPLIIALILTLAALMTCRWWSLPSAPAFPDPRYEVPAAARRWVWLMAGVVALLAMWPRSVRLQHSLSATELATLDNACLFSHAPAPAEDAAWAAPGGSRRLVMDHVAAQFAGNHLGQNPRLNAALEPRIARALPWAAGILSTGIVVLLASALGSPRAGLAAGLIMAMHPQQVQWSSEISDAALNQLCFGTVLLCLLHAMRTNAWRWWLALSAAEAALCFGHPGNFMALLALHVLAAAVLWTSAASRRDKTSHALRLLVVAALAVTTLLFPNSILTSFTPPPPPADLWANTLSGIPFSIGDDNTVSGASLLSLSSAFPWRWPMLFVLLPLVIIAGLWFLLRQDWRTRFAGIVFLVCIPGGTAPGLLLLPIVMVWAGVGLLRLFPRQPRLLHAPLFIAGFYVMATAPALQRTISIPRQPLREVLAAARTAGASTITSFSNNRSYILQLVHGVRELKRLEELNVLVDTAYDNDAPLFVFHTLAARTLIPEHPILRELESSDRFVLTREFPAFDPRDTIRLYRYQPREQIINLQVKPEKK